jgi:peptide/nickel transport system permease protein
MTAEAALAFLGVGIDPSIPTLGRLINAGMGSIFSRPWQVLFPIVVLTILTLAFTLIGDGVRDVLNPRLQSGNKASYGQQSH